MVDTFAHYHLSLIIGVIMAGALLLQLIIADIALFLQKHQAGHPLEPNHAHFVFRAVRAHANTNESISIYILLLLLGIFSHASADWLATFSGLYCLARLAHMCFYYFNIHIARSISFALSLIGLSGMFLTGVISWF
jgi:uncharacterized MAPEG superfamily protein